MVNEIRFQLMIIVLFRREVQLDCLFIKTEDIPPLLKARVGAMVYPFDLQIQFFQNKFKFK